MPYHATLDRNGTEDEITIFTPEGRAMLCVSFWDREEEDDPLGDYADQLKADAVLIVNALNAHATVQTMLEALTLIGNACRVQANLLSTATQPERDKFIGSVFDAWNKVIVPAIENGRVQYDGQVLTAA